MEQYSSRKYCSIHCFKQTSREICRDQRNKIDFFDIKESDFDHMTEMVMYPGSKWPSMSENKSFVCHIKENYSILVMLLINNISNSHFWFTRFISLFFLWINRIKSKTKTKPGNSFFLTLNVRVTIILVKKKNHKINGALEKIIILID